MNGVLTATDTAALIAAERPWLLRVCAALSNDAHAAEDLAQESLLEALRKSDDLYDLQGLRPWLRAIAQHVCARWRRRQDHERTRARDHAHDQDVLTAIPDSWDLEFELERDELATLLDRALALLPAETRSVLIARYLEETPHAQIADRFGMSEGAVAMRLQRGRLALKRVLGDELRHEAAAYGLVGDPLAATQATGIWCPICGQQRLACLIDRESGLARFVCPQCDDGEMRHIASTLNLRLLDQVRSPKAILSRQIDYLHTFYRQALAARQAICLGCGRICAVDHSLPENVASNKWGHYGFSISCDSCRYRNIQPLSYLVLDLPEVQRFWRRHARMRMLPERILSFNGSAASLIAFESLGDNARIEIVSSTTSFEVLALDDKA